MGAELSPTHWGAWETVQHEIYPSLISPPTIFFHLPSSSPPPSRKLTSSPEKEAQTCLSQSCSAPELLTGHGTLAPYQACPGALSEIQHSERLEYTRDNGDLISTIS